MCEIALHHQNNYVMQHQQAQQSPNEVTYFLEASVFQWEISNGKTIEAWGFNRQLPGPELRAKKGDTLVVKVKNNLPEPTIIHWHGIRLEAAMDGTGKVQDPIQPGEVFEYRFQLPDAGTFWYHSHYNETVQMERGMYGSLIVEDESDPTFDNDRVIMLDDMKLTKDNRFLTGNRIQRFIERHDGREGNVNLVNGKEQPVINVNAGQTDRWRFINASSARYIRLHLQGRSFKIISTDGGLIQQPETATEVLLTPGERVDIVTDQLLEGESFGIEGLPYNRVTFLRPKKHLYGKVVAGDKQTTRAFLPRQLRTIEALAPQHAPVSRKVKLSVGPSLKNGLEFLVNNDVHVVDKPVNLGELQVWEVANASLMDHPFHLHGFFFQVIEENGKAPATITWKDTYNLKPRTRVKMAWMPDRVGTWMYHCHILEHHEAGMMATFEVIDPQAPSVPKKHHAHCSTK